MTLAVSKRFGVRVGTERVATGASFFDLDYALIAAVSGWIPIMFITRVRL
jgi:hypothetical protein